MVVKVLVVDDSGFFRRRVSEILSADPNIQVIGTATNGREAIEQAQALKPDVITMDLTMPKMDGLKCINELMELDANVNILVISALSDKATGIRAIELGARGFIYKPFSDETLNEALTEIIEN